MANTVIQEIRKAVEARDYGRAVKLLSRERIRAETRGEIERLPGLLPLAEELQQVSERHWDRTRAETAAKAIRRKLAKHEANARAVPSLKEHKAGAKRVRPPEEKPSGTPIVRCGNVELHGTELVWQEFIKSESLWAKVLMPPNHVTGKEVTRRQELTPHVSATVDTSGSLAEHYYSTLGRSLSGAVIAGLPGAIVGHAAKKKTALDTRVVYLMVDDENWSQLFAFSGASQADARRLAQAINRLNRKADMHQQGDVMNLASELERLSQLRESGVLTADEFEHAKQRILGN